jgi:hypothetical protein
MAVLLIFLLAARAKVALGRGVRVLAQPESPTEFPGDTDPPAQPVPTDMPGSGFPGATAEESNAAWPGGQQPKSLGKWAATEDGVLMACGKTELLQDLDHEQGWPGTCAHLNEAYNSESMSDWPAFSESDCRDICVNEPRCGVWEFIEFEDHTECWVGYGDGCTLRNGHEHGKHEVKGAQRLQHGDVRVLMDLKGWEVAGLSKILVYAGWEDSDPEIGAKHCKAWCNSIIQCEYWQYRPDGCWVDNPLDHVGDPGHAVQYPLTTNGGIKQTDEDVVGEYIQHYCTNPLAPYPQKPPTTTQPPQPQPPQPQPPAGSQLQMPSVEVTTTTTGSAATTCISLLAYTITVGLALRPFLP